MKKILYILLSLVLLVTSMSCEMPAPQLTEKDTSPFQRPQTPQNVRVISGQPDRITISWDHQDDATGFIIYGSRISEIGQGMKQVARVRENVDTVDLLLRSADFDASQSYVFSVRAYKQFEGSNDILYSLDSPKVEGAFAPSRIDLNVALTNDAVKIFYNSPNLYSGLNSTQDTKPLYNAKFTVMYKDIIEDNGWIQPSSVVPSDSYDDPSLFTELIINDEQFIEGRRYLFKVRMDILQPDGSFHSIESRGVELIVSGDMLPTPIKNINVTQGTSLDKITVEWTIPPWTYPVSRANSYFKIERSEDDGMNWDVLIDEITSFEQDERIIAGENNECSFEDTEVKSDKTYIYRFTNGAVVDPADPKKSLYVQDEEAPRSLPAYLYRPEISADSLIGAWTVINDAEDKPTSATVSFNWTLANPFEGADITWALKRIKWTPGSEAEVSEDIALAANVTGTSYSNAEPYTEIYVGDMYAQYYYMLVMKINGTDYYQTDLFKFPEATGDLILGKVIPVPKTEPLIDGITASVDRYGKIVLNWNVKKYDKYTEQYVYQYKFEKNADYVTIDALSGKDIVDGEAITTEISVTPDVNIADKHGRIFLKVSSGLNTFIPEDGFYCEAIHMPAPELLKLKAEIQSADKYVLTWNAADFHQSEKIQYAYEVYKGGVLQKKVDIADISVGTVEIDKSLIESPESNIYKIKLAAYNKDFESEGKAYSETAVLLPVLSGIKASKGAAADNVTVSWTACSIPGATYNVYRYGDDIATRTLVGNTAEASIADTNPDSATPNYTVAVVAEGVEGKIQTKFDEVKNPVGLMEAANKGYIFGTPAFAPVAVSHVMADGSLKPYFTVEFTPDKFISDYEILGASGDITYKFRLADFAEVGENFIANGNNPEAVGYAKYDYAADKVSFNVSFKILDTDLKVAAVTVKGSNGTSNATVTATGEARRALTALDYANVFNLELKEVIYAADRKFGGDWYGGTGASSYEAQVYTDTGLKIANTSSKLWQDRAFAGSMEFTQFNGKYSELNSLKNISLISTNGGDSGYLGTDPLNTIGLNSNNSTTIKLTFDHMISGNPIVYPEATIAINGIQKYDSNNNVHWTGSYLVTVKGQDTVRIDITDKYITTKPY